MDTDESKLTHSETNNEILEKNKNNEDFNFINIDNGALLKLLFKASKEENSKYIPILLKNGCDIINKIFTECPNITENNALKEYILKKINLITQIKEIIGNSYEILYIIFDYLSQKKTSIFINLIELYIKYLTLSREESFEENKRILIDEINKIFSWFLSCGLLSKNVVDYIYQKIALFQLEKKLTLNIFNDILPLLEIIYGKYYDKSIIDNFIAKKYIYFYDKETSLIKTNISQTNSISIKNGFSVVLWFYLNNYDESPHCSLCQIKTNNNQQIEFILTENYDIDVLYNNSKTLKENENKTFNLKQKIWTQLKIEFNSTEISLYIFQKKEKLEINVFDKKTYKISNIKKLTPKNENENINSNEDLNFDNYSITEILFFKNYFGIIGTILFFNKINKEEYNLVPIDSLYGLENKKVNEFVREKKLFSGLYFIFAPSLFLYDQNIIIDSANNVTGELPERPNGIEKNIFNLNSLLTFHNYTNNIFYIGGYNNFLPLFEIFYKFSLEENDINFLKSIFNNLFRLLEITFYEKIKNCLLPLKKETSFFESMRLFMEKIDSKYYYDNIDLLETLIKIANYFDELKTKKVIEHIENKGFFQNIFFNPNLIIKFSLTLQEKFLKKIENYSFVIPSDNMNILLLLLSQKYVNDEIEKTNYSKILFRYINTIFESKNFDDSQRESLFLLYKNNIYSNTISLSDNIFIHVMEIFILYLDIRISNSKYDEIEIKRRKATVNHFLNSNNNFIESLLNYLSETNIHVKKVIINFLRVLTQIYGDVLDQYFIKERKNKKNKKRINKEEFYDFIKENIAPNYSNANIKEEDILTFRSKKSEKDIFFLDDEEENKINENKNKNTNLDNRQKDSKEDIKEKINIKLGHKRNKSTDFKKNKIKEENIKNIQNILGKIDTQKNMRKDSFTKKLKNNLCEKESINIKINKGKEMVKENNINNKKESEKIKEKDMKENDLNQNLNLKKLTLEEKIVIQNTKFEISLVLYNWLVSLITESEKTNDRNHEESIQHVIDYIVKLISYSKELEVIYRTLLLIWDQKDRSKNGQQNLNDQNIYNKLLYYLSKNPLFIQMLIELLINSYMYKNIDNNKKENDFFEIISKSKDNLPKMKEKYFSLIYEHSKELLFDIYFDPRNLSKGEVIIKMFCVILKISRGFEDNIDEKKTYLLFKFLKELFLDICETYKKMEKYPKEEYFSLFTFLIEYSFLLKTADYYVKNTYEKIKEQCTYCFPDFLVFGLIYESKVTEWTGYDIYKIMMDNIKKLLCIDKIFNNLEMIYKVNNNESNNNYNKEERIFIYDIDLVNAIVNEVINHKNKKNENAQIKELFYSYPDEGYDNNFPLINIISLFNSICIYLFYGNINENKKINIISLLNDIQNYIIFLILASCLIKDILSFSQKNLYDQFQIIIYKNLYFNIKNLINHLNDKENESNYLQILHNIILFLSVIYDIEQKETAKNKKVVFFKIFTRNIDLSKIGPIYLVQFYMKNLDNLFNSDNLKFFITNKKENKDKAFELIKENIKKDIIENPSYDLYDLSLFEKIIKKRDSDLKLKLRLLITKENEFSQAVNNYKKIFLKVKSFKNIFNYDESKKNREEILKLKKYRKIKKDLYSFNNSYSNLSIFYDKNNNNNKYLLKYKISNFLSKDMTRKLLKPIIDMNYYLPNFRKYKYESNNMYYHLNDQIYSVDLQIFPNNEIPPISPDINKEYDKNQYYIEENVCYVKTTNHIKGKIFHLNNLDDNCFYFCMIKLPSEEILDKNYEDYDTLNKSCFSSLFRNNMNKKDFDIYLKINFNDIIFIFNRKYIFKDNSIEIFTSNHRSYYFKFKNNEKRNKFLDHLISILNKDSSIFRRLFKPINSIDENNKKIVLGYFKDIDNNNEYSTIVNIRELWKNNNISTLEYIMWINIYGNRSFRDISQFPVLPWIIDDYKINNYKDIIKNDCIRNFQIPMGMMALDEKGKERQEGYILTYKLMSLELKEEEIINFKVKEEVEEEKEETIETSEVSNKMNIDDNKQNQSNINEGINSIITTSGTETNKDIVKKNKSLPKIPEYNYNIEKLYTNLNIEYERIPYCYGSHFSNGMYVSHFLGRLFPYSLTMIEIQGTGFDCSERLFLCLDKTFLSSTNEKCDIRELIPEFYTLPELFLNINKLNFGQININNFLDSVNYINEIIEKNNGSSKVDVQDVILPNWCKYNPYFFIQKKRELLENKIRIDLNPWIDLIFGITQRGVNAQKIGNLFLPYVYDGVMNCRIKDEDILKNREDTEYQLRLFELGVHPTKVFDKKNVDTNKKLRQVSLIRQNEKPFPFISGFEGKIRFIANIGNNYSNLLVYYKNHKVKKIVFEEKLDNENFIIKENNEYKDLINIVNKDISSKLISRYLFKSNIIILTGFYNGTLYVINLDSHIKLNNKNSELITKVNKEDQALLQNYGKGIITSLEVSKDEKYIAYGNDKGTLIIIENDYNIFLENNENKKYLKVLKIISSHSGYIINTISINSDLNLLADCSYDNYIHIYSLPKCEKINSIYIKDIKFKVDYIFLTSQPLASIVLYSNKLCKFKCYNINGHDLNIEQNDKNLYDELKINNSCEPMISPVVFTDLLFNDHLLYIFGYKCILLRKMPLMDIIYKINFNEDEYISFVNVSLSKECIYAFENNSKKVYLIKYKKPNKPITPTNSFSSAGSNK